MDAYDLAVIGAGAAGLSVTAVAAQLGLRVVLIERGRMGGDCLNTGCVPSKALLAAAHAAQSARTAGRLGLRIAEPEIDWGAVQAHVHGAIAALAPVDSVARFAALGADVLPGTARFVAPDTLEVALAAGPWRLTARRIVIAAGGRPLVPRPAGAGPRAAPDQRADVRPDAAPRAPADPGRRPDRAGDGPGPCGPGLPRHRGAAQPHRRA